jgi:hypothetical protein
MTWDDMTMTSSIGTRRRMMLILVAVLVASSAVVASVVLASRPMSTDMVGMGPASGSSAGISPAPAMSETMPGMSHGSAAPTSSPTQTSSADSPWKTHDHSGAGAHSHGSAVTVAPDRPLAAVLGTFGAGTSAVLLTAGSMRHRGRARNQATKAARAAYAARRTLA